MKSKLKKLTAVSYDKYDGFMLYWSGEKGVELIKDDQEGRDMVGLIITTHLKYNKKPIIINWSSGCPLNTIIKKIKKENQKIS